MAEKTEISWTDHTFSPWWGCEKVSPACRGCYAERDAHRYRPDVTLWGPGSVRQVASDAYWKAPIKWAKAARRDGVRRRVFCASMADVFERREDLEEPRARLFRMIEATPELDWLLLTKRPENVLELASDAGWFNAQVWSWRTNVWVGTTVEDQERADLRIPALLAIPAAVRFLSCEPLLGPLRLSARAGELPGLHWIIAGGESGPAARPMHPAWARSLRDQALQAGVAFHFKQWGEWGPASDVDIDALARLTVTDPRYLSLPGGGMVRVGKKRAGRVLDGRTWDEFPAAAVCA